MKPKFKVGQYVIKKMRPVKDITPIPMMGLIMYSRSDTPVYGVFRVDPYIKGDFVAPIEYKVILTPVGKSAEIFLDDDFYTSDLYDTIKPEMIFDDWKLAEAYVNNLTNI